MQWVLVLTPYAATPEAAVMGHSALVGLVALNAEIQRHHGIEVVRAQKLNDPRLPSPVSLRASLEHLIDSLFPGFKKSR